MRPDRVLGLALLVLAAAVAPPALSAAQDVPPDEPQEGTAQAPAPAPSATPPAPAPDAGPAQQSAPPDEQPQPPAAESAQAPAPAPVAAPAPGAQPAEVQARAAQPKAKLAASSSVSIGDNFYSPATVDVNVGDTVTWNNDGQLPHSATADNGSFDTGVLDPGQSGSATFSQPGTFNYFCTVHGQSQSGTVRVSSGGSGGSGGGGASGGGTSEADAVASSDAAGSSSSLPATGFAIAGLISAGLALLGGGMALRPFGHREDDG